MIAPRAERDLLAECTDQDFIDLIKVAEEDVSTWEKACNGENIGVFKKMTDGSPIVLMKAFAFLRGISP